MAVYYGSKRIEGPITTNVPEWLLVWTLDASGSIYSMSRPTVVYSNASGCQGYTYTQLQSYKGGNWTDVMLTSFLYPGVRWVFSRSANSTNLPLFMQTILSGGNPGSYMSINASYSITLDYTRSSVPNSGSNPYQFMHNNNGSEPGDIPTFGVNGGYVWGTGMFWGNIDAFSNYGGLMNTTTALSGPGGGNTGDRLLVYVK